MTLVAEITENSTHVHANTHTDTDTETQTQKVRNPAGNGRANFLRFSRIPLHREDTESTRRDERENVRPQSI